jgi:hypothetical protein
MTCTTKPTITGQEKVTTEIHRSNMLIQTHGPSTARNMGRETYYGVVSELNFLQ